jgi:hypothetical protein
MPRCGNIRRYLREVTESRKAERISYIPPILILIIELIMLEHAISFGEIYVIILTIVLLIISFIELILIIREMHKHRVKHIFDRTLTIKLDDFITDTKITNVKEIVLKFIDRYPLYEKNRVELYKLTCQIMQTHKDQSFEKQYLLRLSTFVKGSTSKDAPTIVKAFFKKYPEYEQYGSEVYDRICKLLETKQR